VTRAARELSPAMHAPLDSLCAAHLRSRDRPTSAAPAPTSALATSTLTTALASNTAHTCLRACGSTAYFAVQRVGEKLKSGELKDIIAIPTSIRTKEQAEGLGIPLATLGEHSVLDVAIDGVAVPHPRPSPSARPSPSLRPRPNPNSNPNPNPNRAGADEVDPQLNLVKGGGGALLREKMVEVRSPDPRAIVGRATVRK